MRTKSDQFWMSTAIELAKQAGERGEVPVGAVLILDDKIIGKGRNQSIELNDPTAHAEIQAITAASNYLGSKYLQKCTLYVTLEPCPMCAGAIYWSQMGRVVFGAKDPKRGFQEHGGHLHRKTELITGIMEHECGEIITNFFQRKRK